MSTLQVYLLKKGSNEIPDENGKQHNQSVNGIA